MSSYRQTLASSSCRLIPPNSTRSSGYGCISETIASRTAFSRPLARSSTPVVTLGIGCSAKPDAFDPCVPILGSNRSAINQAGIRPFNTWPSGVDKQKFTQQVNAALAAAFPGVEFNFSQYIEDNVEETASGVKGENSVKLFGNDLAALEKTATKVKVVMSKVPGIADLAVLNSLGQPTVQIDVDRARAARYGLTPSDIN